MKTFDELIQAGGKKAIRHYWETRTGQLSPRRDGGKVRDQGRRAEATGGKQLDGFLWLIRNLLKEAGVKNAEVFTGQIDSYIPGFSDRPSGGTCSQSWTIICSSASK
jgi:hypothetical protein